MLPRLPRKVYARIIHYFETCIGSNDRILVKRCHGDLWNKRMETVLKKVLESSKNTAQTLHKLF